MIIFPQYLHLSFGFTFSPQLGQVDDVWDSSMALNSENIASDKKIEIYMSPLFL
ncbi:MAG: hypothetical protein ACOC4M_18010 [Promethearchaeia archaeon]